MATQEQVKQALYDAIAKKLEGNQTPNTLLTLAEAYAWVVTPSNAHGGSTSS